jgi:peptidoglycan/xylan/chitin deacetylase (PgdA/CDA1 family)
MDMSGGGLPILTYHAIDATGSAVSTSPAQFTATLDALDSAGYRAVDLGRWIAQGRPTVERGFALTFDDGLRSILAVAGELARRKIVATVFLVTDRMGSDNAWPGQPPSVPRAPLLTWSDARALAGAGFQFAAHGRTHRRLDRCDDASLEDELRGSRDAIEERLGQPCRLLAYPYGKVTKRVRRAAMRHFDAALSTRLDLAHEARDPYQIARIETYYLRSGRALDRLLAGRAGPWLRAWRIARAARGAWTDAALAVHGLARPLEPQSLSMAIRCRQQI